jgi:membrane associated rhomboid family serine protease
LYLLSGLAAAVFHVLLNPGSTLPVVGASGAVAGVMAAYSLLFPRSRLRMFFLFVFYPVFFELPALVFLVIWFSGQLLNALVQLPTGANGDVGGIAFAAHVGGFVAGLLLLPLFRHSKSGLLRWW